MPHGYQIRSNEGRVRFWREVDGLHFGPVFCNAAEAEGGSGRRRRRVPGAALAQGEPTLSIR